MNVGEFIEFLKTVDPCDEICIYILDTGERKPIEPEQIDFLVRDTIDINLQVNDGDL